jgi:hypothetical protein
MAYNGSGVWNRLYNWQNDAANGIKIRADRMDAEFNDMCNNGLSAVLTRDGQGVPTANLPMSNFKHTGAANAAGIGQYLVYGQPQVNLFGNVTAAFGTLGVGLIGNAFTQTDNTTAAGTVATAYASSVGAATFATATNAVTITNAYGAYFANPVAGSHVTLTNGWALGADSLKVVGTTSLASATASGTLGVTGNATVGGTLGVTGNVTLGGALTTLNGITSSNGDISSGGNVTAHGFGVTMTMDFQGINSQRSSPVSIQVISRTGGVILNDGATSWAANSSRTYKNIYGPIPGNPLDRVGKLSGIIFNYKTDAEGTPERIGLVYEDLIQPDALPWAAHYSEEQVLRGIVDGQEVEKIQPESMSVSLEQVVPLLVDCINELRRQLTDVRTELADKTKL